MPLTATEREACLCVVSVFETGRARGDYGAATVLNDGAGISAGRFMATDRADSLDAILQRYLDLGGGTHGDALRPYLDELERDESVLAVPSEPPTWVRNFIALWKQAGADPIMRRAQDEVFDEQYWRPAATQAEAMGLRFPLSWCAVWDTVIQSGAGGVARIRRMFAQRPPIQGGDEKAWTVAYVVARRKWLAAFPNAVVQKTTYRPDALLALVQAGNWSLTPPFKVRSVTVTAADLATG